MIQKQLKLLMLSSSHTFVLVPSPKATALREVQPLQTQHNCTCCLSVSQHQPQPPWDRKRPRAGERARTVQRWPPKDADNHSVPQTLSLSSTPRAGPWDLSDKGQPQQNLCLNFSALPNGHKILPGFSSSLSFHHTSCTFEPFKKNSNRTKKITTLFLSP